MVQAWAHLEKYSESHTFEEALADAMTVPTSMLFGRKCPTGNNHPTSRKRARTAEAEEQTRPAETPLLLFLTDPEELVYPDQDSQELEDTPQQPPDGSLNFLPISHPGTPIAPVSHTDNDSSCLPEYETSSGGRTVAKAMELVTEVKLTGTAGEEIPDGFCLLSLEDFLVRDSWIAWEQELRRARHKRDKSLAFLAMRLPHQFVMAEMLTEEEQARYEIWKAQYLNQPAGLEREITEAGGIGPR